MLLSETLPEFGKELAQLLEAQKPELAVQVPTLKTVEGCACGDDFCSSFYTQPKPKGAYGPGHYTLTLEPANGMLNLDVVNGIISFVELLDRPEIHRKLVVSQFEPRDWEVDLWLLVTSTMRRTGSVQPHLSVTSAHAILKNVGGRFTAWQDLSTD